MQVYLAPMEGVTGYIVRNAFHNNFDHIDKYFTPFIPAAKRLSPKLKRDLAPENNKGIRLVPQLISNRADEILDMIRQLKDYGYDEFNLNLGCPSGTVVSGDRGSGLLRDPDLLERLLGNVYENIDVPLSLKTRIGFNSLNEWSSLLEIYNKYPYSELIIHPRLRNEFYKGFVHLDSFEMAYRSANKNLVYNGDIWDIKCYGEIISRFPDINTVMIGRGLLTRPYLAASIKGFSMSEQQLLEGIRTFCDEIYDGYATIFSSEKDAVIHMKEIWANLQHSFENSEKLVRKLLRISSPAEYRVLTEQIYKLPLT